jgi:hypothetical protein
MTTVLSIGVEIIWYIILSIILYSKIKYWHKGIKYSLMSVVLFIFFSYTISKPRYEKTSLEFIDTSGSIMYKHSHSTEGIFYSTSKEASFEKHYKYNVFNQPVDSFITIID